MSNPPDSITLTHGKRGSYVKGCRCNRCRSANADYFQARRKVGNRNPAEEVVDASRAQEYIKYLSENGVGRNSLHEACGVGKRLIWEIAKGLKTRILRSTEKRILAVKLHDALPQGAFVDGEVTRSQIDELMAEGFTRGDIADRLRVFDDRLRIGERNRVRASSANKISQLYRSLMTDGEKQSNADSYIDAA